MGKFKIRSKTGNNLRFLLRSCNNDFKLSFFSIVIELQHADFWRQFSVKADTPKNSTKYRFFVLSEFESLMHLSFILRNISVTGSSKLVFSKRVIFTLEERYVYFKKDLSN